MAWGGGPRPGYHENKKWLMSILFCSRDDETKSTWVWEGGRVLDHEKSKWLMSISWSHGLPVPLPTYVLSVLLSREQMDMLMRHLMFSWSHETKSTKNGS